MNRLPSKREGRAIALEKHKRLSSALYCDAKKEKRKKRKERRRRKVVRETEKKEKIPKPIFLPV